MIENFKVDKLDLENKSTVEDKTKIERKQPIDMKAFWIDIDKNYFKNTKELNLEKINHVLMNQSYYGIFKNIKLIRY